MKALAYLACPYMHEDRAVRVYRFEQANLAAGKLMQDGYFVFSPISHTHPIAEACDLGLGWDYWSEYDYLMLSHCQKMFVLKLDGWRDSKGVSAEIEYCKASNIPVVYFWERREWMTSSWR